MFQSSIAPKDDRYLIDRRPDPNELSFNPRSPRRTTATCFAKKDIFLPQVSILDRPEGRPLLSVDDDEVWCITRFNPRSPRRTTATSEIGNSLGATLSFNPRSPRRTTATDFGLGLLNKARVMFQSSIAPKDDRYRLSFEELRLQIAVSILDRPEGRPLLLEED